MKIFLHGRGTVSAAGSNSAAAWAGYASGLSTWKKDPVTGLPVYGVEDLPDRPAVASFAAGRRADRVTELALYAADEAVRQAGWTDTSFSILVGCSRGPTTSWEAGFDIFREKGTVPTRTSPQTTLGGIGFALADYFGNVALSSSLSVTCSSGFHALLHGVALLRSGLADRVLVGGAEAPLTTFTLRQLEALRIVAPVPNVHAHACRPFSTPASGMALGEGAAFFALSREPGPYEISALGFAREAAGSATGITPDASALHAAMQQATAQAGPPNFIVAHAPGTKRGDAAEARAIQRLRGDAPGDAAVTSFKWATGHTFGASGPLALDAAISVLEHQSWLPLPYGGVGDAPRSPGRVLVNATGFGGNAVCVGVEPAPPAKSLSAPISVEGVPT